MAIKISKNELLAGARLIPSAESGLAPQPLGIEPTGGLNLGSLDTIERVLMQIDSILGHVEHIRGGVSAITQKKIGPVNSPPADTPIIRTEPQPSPPQSTTETKIEAEPMKKPELSDEGTKAVLADLMKELETAPADIKEKTIGSLLGDYKSDLKRPFVEQLVINLLKKHFDRLIK